MAKKKKNSAKSVKRWGILIALTIIPLMACMWTLNSSMNKYVDEFEEEMWANRVAAWDNEGVQDFIGVRFPDSAENVYTIGVSALDTIVAARFDVPIDDLQPYLNEIGITEQAVQGELPFLTTSLPIFGTPDWWQVSEAETMDYSGLSDFVSPKYYNIMIVNLDDETVRIYMTAYTI